MRAVDTENFQALHSGTLFSAPRENYVKLRERQNRRTEPIGIVLGREVMIDTSDQGQIF